MKNIPRIVQLKWFIKSTKNVVQISHFGDKESEAQRLTMTYSSSQSQVAQPQDKNPENPNHLVFFPPDLYYMEGSGWCERSTFVKFGS